MLPGVDGFNAYLRVDDVTKSTIERYNGNERTNVQVAEGHAGDETGLIKFRVVGEYAPVLEKGKVVAFRNARSEVIRGFHQIGLDRFGRVTVEDVVSIIYILVFTSPKC